MQFATTLQKAYKLEVNATGMSMANNQQHCFKFRKTMRHAKLNKKT